MLVNDAGVLVLAEIDTVFANGDAFSQIVQVEFQLFPHGDILFGQLIFLLEYDALELELEGGVIIE
jgi:hypothetical protein